MKSTLPPHHGLPDSILNDPELVMRTDPETPSLTDVQYEALSQGAARGTSMLVVAPTSTGKTLIGVWALTTWLLNAPPRNAVYLVTHRALARQKFEELQALLCERYFQGDKHSIVLANGDTIEDGAGSVPTDPLNAPVLVATYEKYLAMLSGSGSPSDTSRHIIICDEIQIIGDEHRGRSIEVLLTMLRNARWGQFIGLSAVIDPRDAKDLSEWLGAKLVHVGQREKHLHYECRTLSRIRTFRTDRPELGIEEKTPPGPLGTEKTIAELKKNKSALPIVVFCMTRKRVDEAVRAYAQSLGMKIDDTHPLHPKLHEPTAAARNLSQFIPRRFAFHNAELMDDERRLVEDVLKNKALDIVFATSTLAAGVNFPFKTAVFDEWKRWNPKTKTRDPLPASEFQNMAGRVGRMGTAHSHGAIIFSSTGTFIDAQASNQYLQPDRATPLTPRITPTGFSQLALQLVSSGVCLNESDVAEFLSSTFSAMRERESNQTGLEHWRRAMAQSIQALREWGFLL
ncbi:DEAD/DEAH box helicase domain protein [Myxococcus hansupus]|uniref:DEAD/DEAH box helicase domain protein n=1 Tax=Pseudomyxococcus hansupus TaxID=1297742 RepID=A0A0H4XDC6_9BACT|nr:DEAD/DEAH box helicase [Myxococcus hansupus]AKQ66027.1 DEAD/DEAH box helicase domain protein [Myxococcus hansupus]